MPTSLASACPLPLIGVSMRLLPQAHTGDMHDALSQDWGRFFAAAGIAWLPLPNRGEETLALAQQVGVGGFLFSGGGDAGREPARDHTENLLLRYARERNVPVVGVCRGFQALQRALGGDLVPVEGHVAVEHILWPAPGSALGPALGSALGQAKHDAGDAERRVNSYHALGIARCAAPLIPCAFSREPCGAQHVEAAWAPGLLGIMWHPERCAQPDTRDVHLIRHFLGKPGEQPPLFTSPCPQPFPRSL